MRTIKYYWIQIFKILYGCIRFACIHYHFLNKKVGLIKRHVKWKIWSNASSHYIFYLLKLHIVRCIGKLLLSWVVWWWIGKLIMCNMNPNFWIYICVRSDHSNKWPFKYPFFHFDDNGGWWWKNVECSFKFGTSMWYFVFATLAADNNAKSMHAHNALHIILYTVYQFQMEKRQNRKCNSYEWIEMKLYIFTRQFASSNQWSTINWKITQNYGNTHKLDIHRCAHNHLCNLVEKYSKLLKNWKMRKKYNWI